MNKKYTLMLLTIIFLLGMSSPILCLTNRPDNKSNCCSNAPVPIPAPSEDCLWHCASKKIVGAKAEDFSIESLKTNILLFLNDKAVDALSHLLRHSNHPADYYLNQETARLTIHQDYFEAIFNRAPPVIC